MCGDSNCVGLTGYLWIPPSQLWKKDKIFTFIEDGKKITQTHSNTFWGYKRPLFKN